MSQEIAAGFLIYRMTSGFPEVFLVHNGGPYFANKDERGWSFPKGHVKEAEDPFEGARREFKEETSFDIPETKFIEIGSIKSRNKTVHAWAFEHTFDISKMKSNTCLIEWPPRSGKKIEIPEVDRGEYFDLQTARKKIFAYLEPLIDALEQKIK